MTRDSASATEVAAVRVRGDVAAPSSRTIPAETAVAIVHDGTTFAVMMATPADLEDFAIGLSLGEGVIDGASQVRDLEIVSSDLGVEARLWLEGSRGRALVERRRAHAGPTGCGLCGVESLEAARAAPMPSRLGLGPTIAARDVGAMLAALAAAQTLGAATRAVHAAGFWTASEGLVALREDVGRHNALDKLAGALAREGRSGHDGVVVLTSRVSVEMVQKTLRLGASILVAVSAPTGLAVRTAEAHGLTLIAVARADGFEVFSHPQRLKAMDTD